MVKPRRKTNTKAQAAESMQQPNFVKADDYRSIYANNVRFHVSLFDLKMNFGEAEPEGNVIKQHVGIFMSLHHAKAFSAILAHNLEKYEEQFGEIKGPDPKKHLG
jgi:hypothetical protein